MYASFLFIYQCVGRKIIGSSVSLLASYSQLKFQRVVIFSYFLILKPFKFTITTTNTVQMSNYLKDSLQNIY